MQSVSVAMETPDNKIVWLHCSVLEFLNAEATSKAPLETGGILLGYFRQPGNVPVILQATGPGPQAIHMRYYYRPDHEFDESQIATLYKKSNRQTTYLGDWHTHPLPIANLSYRDKRTLRRIAKCKSARVDAPLMLILSYDNQWEPTIWQGKLHKNYILRKILSTTELTIRLFG